MQKSPTTSRMQSSNWVNYCRPVSMTRFAAAVRAGPSLHCTAITCQDGITRTAAARVSCANAIYNNTTTDILYSSAGK